MGASQTEVFHEPPCAGCSHATRCAERHLACQTFQDYADARPLVRRGTHRARYVGPRVPTRELFVHIYGGAEAAA
jgi:hypothetical protein